MYTSKAISLLLLATLSRAAFADLRVDADIPGGNILVDKIDGNVVHLRQDQRDTDYPWFYWHFRVLGAQGRTLEFRFTRGPVLGPRGPAVSRDAGKNWTWLGADANQAGFRFAFAAADADVRFCFGIPYLQTNLDEFLKRRRANNSLKVETLCRSRKGRAVELLRLGRLDGKADRCALLTARHHACEMPAGFALEGLIDAVLADMADGRWLRDHVEFWIVPFVDMDGVEDGDQGKLRKPHDPWLDYAGTSIYPAVSALREKVPAWAGGRLRVALDCHAPARLDQRIYFAASPRKDIADNTERLAAILQKVQTGPLTFDARDNLPFGRGWNNKETYGKLKSFAQWAEELPGVQVAATLELPYATVRDQPVTPESARTFGADLARALRRLMD